MKIWLVLAAFLVAVFVLLRQPELPVMEAGGVISYKGLVQPTDYEGVDNHSCTATRLTEVQHPYIENTIPAIAQAFALGAEVVHINAHATADGSFVLFHDWTLECRTNGTGVTSEQSIAYLKSLDVGHGYQVLGATEHPFRGAGVGLMPQLSEVLERFPDGQFLINMKTDSAPAVAALVEFLQQLPAPQRERLSFIGSHAVTAAVAQRFPALRVFSSQIGKACLIRYALYGWSRFYPAACKGRDLILPEKYARFLWGWPEQFAARAQSNDSRIYLYQTASPYREASDLRASGVGLFTGDMLGVAAQPGAMPRSR